MLSARNITLNSGKEDSPIEYCYFDIMESMKDNRDSCCSAVRQFQRSSISRWGGVSEMLSSLSAKSWERVMPKASQIFSMDAREGVIFFLYHDEMVDCGRPDRSAS